MPSSRPFARKGAPWTRLSLSLRGLHRNYERFGPEHEKIGTEVRANRYRSANESGAARSVEEPEKPPPAVRTNRERPGAAPRIRPQRRSEDLRHADTKYEAIGSGPPGRLPYRRFQDAWPGVSGRSPSFYARSSRFFRRWRRYISARGSSTCCSCLLCLLSA
jgi:hypothetical protein